MPIKPVTIISDNPESKTNFFGFEAYTKTISGIIINKNNKTPLVIGIYGAWGSGKTTLMQTVKQELDKEKFQKSTPTHRRCKTVWFQAWKYAKEEEILAGFIEEIFKSMKADGFILECKAQIEELVTKINIPKLSEKLIKFVGGGEFAQIFTDPEYKKKLGFYDIFQDIYDRLIWDYLSWRPKVRERETWNDDTKGALVVFIDDLDRCPPDKIPLVLETIKLFLDKPGCIFVIGAAHDIILKALEKNYEADAVRFMDKIVQVSFNLPQIPVNDFELYINETIPEMKEELVPHLSTIIPAIQNNPRQLKRFFNNLNLMEGIRLNRDVNIEFRHLLYWSIIEYVSPQLKDEICDNPGIFETLKQKLKILAEKTDSEHIDNIPENLITPEIFPQSLHVYLRNKGLMNILLNFDASKKQIEQLITFGGIVETPGKTEKKEEIIVNTEGMVKIQAGDFLKGENKKPETIEIPFLIDIYPVTNEQFRAFIDAGAYENKDLWTLEGWKWKQENKITQPAMWNNEKFNSPGCPVVGVNYYEAHAYAKWCGKQIPTEAQWERAARGTQGNEYPWGNDFDPDKCNTRESELGKISRVTRYPNGVSPSGCYDMSGNIREWTTKQSGNFRILKGGAWSDLSSAALTYAKSIKSENMRDSTTGFRCITQKE
ncbi:SUMF1/EgtB/PvdO family nonheme iron enzyme [Desulfobacterales bacterium HSG17]|nr:SUMF1/EgtB/PvdO family nonheme iron enzyme [Desulfobacterales bacterium HSG17]